MCCKVFSLKIKKNHQKDASHSKNNKNSSHIRKTMKRGKMKNEKNKFNNVTTAIKLLTFIFSIRKSIYFARKHSSGKCNIY